MKNKMELLVACSTLSLAINYVVLMFVYLFTGEIKNGVGMFIAGVLMSAFMYWTINEERKKEIKKGDQ